MLESIWEIPSAPESCDLTGKKFTSQWLRIRGLNLKIKVKNLS